MTRTAGRAAVRARLAALGPAQRKRFNARVDLLLERIGTSAFNAVPDRLARLAMELEHGGDAESWLSLATLAGSLPDGELVARVRRRIAVEGGTAGIDEIVGFHGNRLRKVPDLSIVDGGVLIDVSGLAHGGARVFGRGAAIATVRRWARRQEAQLVTWTPRGDALRRLTVEESTVLGVGDGVGIPGELVVPWKSRYLLAGIVDSPGSADRAIALGTFSGNAGGTLGFGLDPVFNAEAEAYYNGPLRYSWHLAVVRSLPHVVAGSERAGIEYRGWKRMLSALGIAGPDIAVVPFPFGESRESYLWGEAADAAWLQLIG
jgi:hypothetical protein